MNIRHLMMACLAVSPLLGCSTFTDSIARSASEMATQNAVKAMREVDLDRQVHLTMVGGMRLNPGRNSSPRPVQVCAYVVQTSDWRPPAQTEPSGCLSKERDVNIVASTRQVVAPGQIQQVQMQVSGIRELWLVLDADYAQRPVDYVPLRTKVEGRGWVHLTAWLDGVSLFDGRQSLPAVLPQSSANAPINESPTEPARLETPSRKDGVTPARNKPPRVSAPRRNGLSMDLGGQP